MVRVFEDKDVIHVANKIDPLFDIGVINLELILSDLEVVNKRIESNSRDQKRGVKEAITLHEALEKLKTALENEVMARNVSFEEQEKPLVAMLNLLTMKPMLYALNTSAANENKIKEVVAELDGPYVEIDPVFETGFETMIKASYELLNLETYFTTGLDETRAWTIKIGSTAPVAGMAIHTDFKDKFIRAEVINWETLISAGSHAEARSKGLIRTEGKEYIVKDGDVIEFLI